MAVNLIAHCGTSSGDISPLAACQNIRFIYSANIRAITAFPPKIQSEEYSGYDVDKRTWLERGYRRPGK
jgi:hypothetical protein